MKGKVQEKVGQVTNDPNMETEGKDEKTSGKIQKKIGQIEKVCLAWQIVNDLS